MISYRHILLVDDDSDDLFFFKEAMKRITTDIRITEAVNGIEALELLGTVSPQPDIIFLDINMPRMDGKECLTLLKKSPHLRHIPVLMLTTSAVDAPDCFSLGAHAYFIKPMNINGLVVLLRQALQTDFALNSRMEFGLK